MKNVDTLVVIAIIAVIVGLVGVSYIYTEAQDAQIEAPKETKEISDLPEQGLEPSNGTSIDLTKPGEAPAVDTSLNESMPLKDVSSDDLTGAEGFEPTGIVKKDTNQDPLTKSNNPLEKSNSQDSLVNNSTKENIKMDSSSKTNLTKPAMQIDPSKTYIATISTNQGDIVIKLDPINKPVTTNNFVALAKMGYYDDVIFHRVIDGFMIQGGDPLGNGTGGPGYSFKDEVSAPNNNKRGTISMANSGPNTNGSQFFINQADNNFLDPKHTVFGEVASGMDVVDKIAKVQKGPNDKPINDVVMKKVVITEQ